MPRDEWAKYRNRDNARRPFGTHETSSEKRKRLAKQAATATAKRNRKRRRAQKESQPAAWSCENCGSGKWLMVRIIRKDGSKQSLRDCALCGVCRRTPECADAGDVK